jgi:hypothetical protein
MDRVCRRLRNASVLIGKKSAERLVMKTKQPARAPAKAAPPTVSKPVKKQVASKKTSFFTSKAAYPAKLKVITDAVPDEPLAETNKVSFSQAVSAVSKTNYTKTNFPSKLQPVKVTSAKSKEQANEIKSLFEDEVEAPCNFG